MPKEINSFTLERKFRGVNYIISAKRDDKKAAGVYVDGNKCEDGILPLAKAGETIKAEVIYR